MLIIKKRRSKKSEAKVSMASIKWDHSKTLFCDLDRVKRQDHFGDTLQFLTISATRDEAVLRILGLRGWRQGRWVPEFVQDHRHSLVSASGGGAAAHARQLHPQPRAYDMKAMLMQKTSEGFVPYWIIKRIKPVRGRQAS